MPVKKHILPLIVIAQFLCTSLWFAGNAVMSDLAIHLGGDEQMLTGMMTSAVQFGFIIGTLVFAFFNIADKYKPTGVFLVSAILAAVFNLLVVFVGKYLEVTLLLRFLTGFFLAGIYPVGMKIAADHYEKGLGTALGYLVGALVLGTAFPHFLKGMSFSLAWEQVLMTTSLIAIVGGVLIYTGVPDGPFRTTGAPLKLNAVVEIFKNKPFKAAATGYFGHMWELYTFWAFVPLMLAAYAQYHTITFTSISQWSFWVIAIGSVGCVIGGYIATKAGSLLVAKSALIISGVCCLFFPIAFQLPLPFFVTFLLIWGVFVIMDSPQFSTLVAQTAPKELKGTALTIVNSLGFAITVVSIQLLTFLQLYISFQYLMVLLVIGPIIGVRKLVSSR